MGPFYKDSSQLVRPDGFDPETDKQVTIGWNAHQLNQGNRFQAASFLTSSDGGVLNVGILTPSSRSIDLEFSVYANSRIEYRLFRDAVVTSGSGAVVPIYNMNDESVNSSAAHIQMLVTVTTTGTELYAFSMGKEGANPVAGDSHSSLSDRRRLKPGAQYVFQVISRDDDNIISGLLQWNELQ